MTIYKVTCLVNGKVYIGKTVNKLNKRKLNHIAVARTEKRKSVFHKAILKYGAENFVWETLCTVMFSETLFDLERFYIAKYNCMIPNGYNMTVGGEGSTGYVATEETKKLISKNHYDISGKNHPHYGKKFSREYRQKISDSHADVSGENNPKSKLKASDVEKIRNSDLTKLELSEQFGVSRSTISSVLNNRTWRV